MGKSSSTRKIGRDATKGTWTTVAYAKAHPRTTTVETIKVPRKGK